MRASFLLSLLATLLGAAERPRLAILTDIGGDPDWGGQFLRGADGWHHDVPAEDGRDPRETVSRWRPDFQRDFAPRMRRCLPE
jgi:hypothetical protein